MKGQFWDGRTINYNLIGQNAESFPTSLESSLRPNLLSENFTDSKSNLWKMAYFWKSKLILESNPFWAKMAYFLENLWKMAYFQK
jgi:hypothetical protein